MEQTILRRNLILGAALPLAASAAESKGEKAIWDAMDAWRKAMMNHDRDALEKLYHKDLTYTHSNAKVENKQQAIDAVMAAKTRSEAIEWPGATVRVYGNTGIFSGIIESTTRPEGKVTVGKLHVIFVWIHDQGKWQLVARQATRPA